MKTLFTFCLVLILGLGSLVGCCKNETTEPSPTPVDTTHGPVVRKPNIYLYPQITQWTSIEVVFPNGGKILESEPHYGNGWLVEIEPSGKINGTYDYLFYEAQTPNHYQYSSGWIIQRDTLSEFFLHILSKAGFRENEIRDFIDYWPPRLNNSEYYAVYPQQRDEVEKMIILKVSPEPQTRLRLFFIITPILTTDNFLEEPKIATAFRGGYSLAEWGVVLE
jgi:hypothetical protein